MSTEAGQAHLIIRPSASVALTGRLTTKLNISIRNPHSKILKTVTMESTILNSANAMNRVLLCRHSRASTTVSGRTRRLANSNSTVQNAYSGTARGKQSPELRPSPTSTSHTCFVDRLQKEKGVAPHEVPSVPLEDGEKGSYG